MLKKKMSMKNDHGYNFVYAMIFFLWLFVASFPFSVFEMLFSTYHNR